MVDSLDRMDPKSSSIYPSLPSKYRNSSISGTPGTTASSSPDHNQRQPSTIGEESSSHFSSPSKSQKTSKMGHRNSQNPLAFLFSRNKKRSQKKKEQKGEGSPLLWHDRDGKSSLSSYHDASQDGSHSSSHHYDPELGTTPFHPVPLDKKDYWKVLKQRIVRGDLLLSGASSDSLQDRTRKTGNFVEKREHELQQAIDEIRKGMGFRLWHGIVAILIYLGISVACFNTIFEPEWTVLDSMYFAMVTLTTVGYGDEVPTSGASMVFTCVYALSGVAILGVALGILGSNLVDAQEAMANKAEDLLKFQVLSVFDNTSGLKTKEQILEEDQKNEDESAEIARRPTLLRSSVALLRGFLPLLALLLGMAYWIGHRAGWTLLEIIYFLVVTATTVGFGDFTPKSDEEKMIALLFIPIAVGAMGVWLGGVANIIVESRSARYRRNMGMKELTQHDLDIMDRDGDGTVTRAEFLEFMLVAMNKIDQDLVEELRRHFDRLDADGTGELTKNDLIEVARKKLHSPVHKLRLSMYKKRLMETSRPRHALVTEWSTRFFSGLGFNSNQTPV